MILDQCPHCGTRHVQTQTRFGEALDSRDGKLVWLIERCQNQSCQRLILVEKINAPDGAVQQVYPFVSYHLDPKAPIPTAIAEDFREAGLCLGASCFKASLVMSRRVLQRCLSEQGCTQNRLVDAISAAIKDGVLRKAFHPVAEEIRQYGNLGAHPDDDQLKNANRESAQQVLEFARLLIHEFYEIPASASLLKQNRQTPKVP
jgi:hypothetical protein